MLSCSIKISAPGTGSLLLITAPLSFEGEGAAIDSDFFTEQELKLIDNTNRITKNDINVFINQK